MRALSQLRAEARRAEKLRACPELLEAHRKAQREAARRRRVEHLAATNGTDFLSEIVYGGQSIKLRADGGKFALGNVCRQGHRWPGSDLCLRRGHAIGNCVLCTSRLVDLWWLKFADWGTSGFGNKTLGKLCTKEHRWEGMPVSLRQGGHCVVCERLRMAATLAERTRRWKESGGQRRAEGKRRQRYETDPEYRARRDAQMAAMVERKRQIRAERLAQGLTTNGTTPVNPDDAGLQRWLRRPVISRPVWKLVRDESRRHWRDHPEDRLVIMRPIDAHAERFKWLTDESYRLYHREKTRRRKSHDRKVWLQRVTAADLRRLRAKFGGRCAYCGVKCDAEIDHFMPIAKGGTHVLSNLLPACHGCNSSKRDHDPEEWYRRQPFFTDKRWRAILAAMGKRPGQVAQLTLI